MPERRLTLRRLLTGFLPGLLLAGLCGFSPAQAACDRPITVAFFDFGLLYHHDTGQGLDRDVVEAVMRRAGCSYRIEFDSRPRIWARMKEGRLDMTVSGVPTTERRIFAHFLPYFWSRNQLVSLADAKVPDTPAAFLDNPALRLGVVRSFRHGSGWDEWIDRLRKLGRVDEVGDTQSLVNLLRARRIAAFPGLPAVTGALSERYDLREKVTLHPWFKDQPKIEAALVISRQRLPAATTIALERALESLRKDGTLLTIFRRHFPEAEAQDLLTPGPELPPIRFIVSSAWSLPFLQLDRHQAPVGGIVIDLANAIGDALRRKPAFVVMPRNRLDEAMFAGAADVRCYSSPQWAKSPERYLWSGVLFELPDVLFGHTGSMAPQSVDQIPAGALIGTVLGYTYPALESAFESRRLIRQDATDQEKVFLKVANRRNDFAVSNAHTLDWMLRRHRREEIASWRVKLGTSDFRCGVAKTSTIQPEIVVSVIDQLKSSGDIQRILDAYR